MDCVKKKKLVYSHFEKCQQFPFENRLNNKLILNEK